MSTPTDPTRQLADYPRWLCPAPTRGEGRPHLAPLPCEEHGVEDVDMGSALYGNCYLGGGSIVAGTVQDSQFGEDTTSVRALDVVLLLVGALLVLVGVVRDALHRRGPS